MFTQQLRKAVSSVNPIARIFSKPQMRIDMQAAPLPIRHFDFKFDSIGFDRKFYLQAELASAYFSALSIFLTYGEDLVIDTARYHRDFIDDPILKQRLTSLIGQEALHSKIHEEWNEVLRENGYPVTFFRYLAEIVFDYGFNRLPQPMKLSLMAAIEHFTAVLAEFMMKHEANFFESEHEKQRALWMWHMLEESEHKDIAYDAFQTLSGNYALRAAGFFPAMITILGLILIGGLYIPFYANPKKMFSFTYWRDVKRSLGLLYGKDGVYGSTIGHVFEYLKPSFHPNDHDTSMYLAYYKSRLFDPDIGVLTPYYIKSFTPKVQPASKVAQSA